eukprot:symbB.v1.2.008822.t1/scaffold533.1/size203693/1
MPRIMGTAE